jgi:hypothetical protein
MRLDFFHSTKSLFYTSSFEKVALHLMVHQPYDFSFAFKIVYSTDVLLNRE